LRRNEEAPRPQGLAALFDQVLRKKHANETGPDTTPRTSAFCFGYAWVLSCKFITLQVINHRNKPSNRNTIPVFYSTKLAQWNDFRWIAGEGRAAAPVSKATAVGALYDLLTMRVR
jgi:hypothetical protein